MTNQPAPAARNARHIPVFAFRQILMWPVLLEHGDRAADADDAPHQGQLKAWVDCLTEKGWREKELLPPAGPIAPARQGNEATYEEVVYFHPFIRDFFYGDGTEPPSERVMRRLVRDDIAFLDLHLESPQSPEFRFRVPRVELYLCKPLVAMLVVEVVWDESLNVAPDPSTPTTGEPSRPRLSLADVLCIQRRIRQVYPPFFASDKAGHCPKRIVFRADENNQPGEMVFESDFDRPRCCWAGQTQQGAEPPVAWHWRKLLEPLRPFLRRGEMQRSFRQIVDDRIPSMVYLSVDDPRSISPGDMDRLVWCEDSGRSPFPYAGEFLGGERAKHVYDRYWSLDKEADRAGELELTTRYLCSGFQFVALGRHGNWFFDELILDHWRRHYLRIGMFAHFHRAALLKFADEMGEAVKLLKGLAPRREMDNSPFLTRIQTLQMTYLKFLARAWFSEVSNQLQGQELFRWWSGMLGNDRLFQEVDAINDEIHSAMNNRYNQRLSEHGMLWSIGGWVVAVASLFVAVWGLVADKTIKVRLQAIEANSPGAAPTFKLVPEPAAAPAPQDERQKPDGQ